MLLGIGLLQLIPNQVTIRPLTVASVNNNNQVSYSSNPSATALLTGIIAQRDINVIPLETSTTTTNNLNYDPYNVTDNYHISRMLIKNLCESYPDLMVSIEITTQCMI